MRVKYTNSPQHDFKIWLQRFLTRVGDEISSFWWVIPVVALLVWFFSPSRRGWDTRDVAKEMESRYGMDVYISDYGKPDGYTSVWGVTARENRDLTFFAWSEYERSFFSRTYSYELSDNYQERQDIIAVKAFAEEQGVTGSVSRPDMQYLRYRAAYSFVCEYSTEEYTDRQMAKEAALIMNYIGDNHLRVDYILIRDNVRRIDRQHGMLHGGVTEEGVLSVLDSNIVVLP